MNMHNLAKELNIEGARLRFGMGEQTTSRDAQFLLSALLLFAAKGDGNISSLESQKMIELLSKRLNLTSSEALESLSGAVMSLADDQDIVQKLRKMSERLSAMEKQEVFTMMLEVAAIDGKRDSGEIEAINFASRILDMSQHAVHEAFGSYFSNK